jgi:hypothetical protein
LKVIVAAWNWAEKAKVGEGDIATGIRVNRIADKRFGVRCLERNVGVNVIRVSVLFDNRYVNPPRQEIGTSNLLIVSIGWAVAVSAFTVFRLVIMIF